MTTCGRCPATWTGLTLAHCAVCHETFTTPANFDRHRAGSRDGERRQGECSGPSVCGLVLNSRGYWGQPGRDDQ